MLHDIAKQLNKKERNQNRKCARSKGEFLLQFMSCGNQYNNRKTECGMKKEKKKK